MPSLLHLTDRHLCTPDAYGVECNSIRRKTIAVPVEVSRQTLPRRAGRARRLWRLVNTPGFHQD
jgi:hypothetical protein